MKSQSDSTDSLRIQFHQQYVAKIREEAKQAEEDLEHLRLRLEALRSEEADAEKVLVNLQRRAGIVPTPTPARPDGEVIDEKHAVFEGLAKQRGDQGFTIADIFKIFADQKVKIGRNYPYFLVDMRYKTRLRKVGATRNGKRYYWITNETASDKSFARTTESLAVAS
jgi:hypothetical protein